MRNEYGIERTKIDINLTDLLASNLDEDIYDGDIITFFPISDNYGNIVTIEGAINRPGTYQLTNGMKVEDLISKADGLNGASYLEAANITRVKDDMTFSQIVINLEKAIINDSLNNIYLQSNDVLTVFDFEQMRFKTDLKIEGHVFNPGSYQFKSGMTVKDLIFLANRFI